jgi:hypothetical protein
MNSISKYLRPITHVLILSILLQSCAIYRSDPVSLDQAAQANTKTMVFLKDGKVEKFKHLTVDNNQYFGVRQVGRDFVTIPIDPDEVSYLRVKNKKATIIVAAAGAAALLGLVIAGSNYSPGGLGSW